MRKCHPDKAGRCSASADYSILHAAATDHRLHIAYALHRASSRPFTALGDVSYEHDNPSAPGHGLCPGPLAHVAPRLAADGGQRQWQGEGRRPLAQTYVDVGPRQA